MERFFTHVRMLWRHTVHACVIESYSKKTEAFELQLRFEGLTDCGIPAWALSSSAESVRPQSLTWDSSLHTASQDGMISIVGMCRSAYPYPECNSVTILQYHPQRRRHQGSPVRAFCPLCPRPDVFPMPEPMPLPTLLNCRALPLIMTQHRLEVRDCTLQYKE